jgi:hypothetical protein
MNKTDELCIYGNDQKERLFKKAALFFTPWAEILLHKSNTDQSEALAAQFLFAEK